MEAPSYDAYFYSVNLRSTSVNDVFGIGGEADITSKDGTVLARYWPEDGSSAVQNVSGKTLTYSITLRFPQVYKSGSGRPKLGMAWYKASPKFNNWTSAVTVNGGAQDKGYVVHSVISIDTGGHMRYRWTDLLESAAMLPTEATVVVTDDVGDLKLRASPLREVQPSSTTSVPGPSVGPVDSVYTSLSWATPASSTDQIGLVRSVSLLPPGITYSNSVLKNVSNTDFNSVYVNTFLAGTSFTNYGYTANSSGDFGGVSSGRLMATIGFSVGAVITFTGPGTNNTVTGVMSFSTRSIANRHADMVV